jgi:hypothetical protein
MDPYLEPHWLDVHTALVGEARRFLNAALPDGLVARAEERIAVESDDEPLHRVGPDVRIFVPSTVDAPVADGAIVIDAPYKLVVDLDPQIERFIRIVDAHGQLITVIDFLSPANKRQPGLDAFREKREELLVAGVHVVEVDLVRTGNWRALMRPEVCPAQAVTTYRAIVRTARPHPVGYLFPISLREPLPEVPIPLRASDQPVKLPLQAMIVAAYDGGRYGRTIDYSRPPEPPLNPEDQAWTETLLQQSRSA